MDSNAGGGLWISHNIFAMYQMMFAIITPALIVGAIAERMKYSAILLFVTLWMFVVYFPLAHMVWGTDGFMNGLAIRTRESRRSILRAAPLCTCPPVGPP